jgi:hypothetical protein
VAIIPKKPQKGLLLLLGILRKIHQQNFFFTEMFATSGQHFSVVGQFFGQILYKPIHTHTIDPKSCLG